ncbi:MAG: malto-oligosyltrehalose trehalohydrolase [candidate division Zixibacteria bacterium]|nr:malto-oligosyltrehalose trehalohydrolase [candidate division Zixibacteria bacterium]
MTCKPHDKEIGARILPDGSTEFNVWAPKAKKVELELINPAKKNLPMNKGEFGYWSLRISEHPGEIEYYYRLNGEVSRPDPASHCQPFGVHKQSKTVNHEGYRWNDVDWKNIPLEEMTIYELHVGAFTSEGTFEAVIPRLDDLKELGINTISIMPVSQFPGKRNWGYDGVHPFAVQDSYGGPEGLKKLVDAAHSAGIAVMLDVVYNHLGPEGNYLHEFAPYFTEKYQTPWGWAINYDDADSGGVRNFFIRNALFWFEKYHIDGLRLDAIHGIFDFGAKHFLRELAEAVDKLFEDTGKRYYLIAESNLNDRQVITPLAERGMGMDSQWSDDFHHAVHTLLTGERDGYYEDFGKIEHLVKAFKEGYVYDWRYSPYRKRMHGSYGGDLPGENFVISTQTHDQVGNRLMGERLSSLVSYEALKLAAVSLMLAPDIPMLYMGEEYAEEAPFLYFVSHGDENLIRAVREGRKKEFEDFKWKTEPPDPQSAETFLKSKLNWELRNDGKHRKMLELYTTLLKHRKHLPALSNLDREALEVHGDEHNRLVRLKRKHRAGDVFAIMNYSNDKQRLEKLDIESECRKLLYTAEVKWNGSAEDLAEKITPDQSITIAPLSAVLLLEEV